MKSPDEIKLTQAKFGVGVQEAQTLEHIGDGVYASFDGYHVNLRLFDGFVASRRIALEPAVMDALNEFRKRVTTSTCDVCGAAGPNPCDACLPGCVA